MADNKAVISSPVAWLGGIVLVIGVLIPSLIEPNYSATLALLVALAIVVAGQRVGSGALRGTGLLIGVFIGFYFWSPLWHGLFYGVYYKAPGILQWLVVGALFVVAAIAVDGYRGSKGKDSGLLPSVLFTSGVLIAVVGALFMGLLLGNIYAQEHMANEVSEEVETLESLPEVDVEHRRSLPESVASNYARNSLQTPRYQLNGGDITFIDGVPHWSYALAPDGLYNTITIQQDGAVYVNMTTQNKDVDVRRGEFKYGQGMAVFDHYLWQLHRSDYANDYRDPFIVPHDSELYMAVPYVEHKHQFRAGLPMPQVYSVPEFGGVKLISQDGEIEDLSPAEAQNDSRLTGQNIYPYDLARFRVNSMRFQHGALNTWFTHRDQLQLADVPGQGNGQPFTVDTENGIEYFVAAEPYGENTHGVYQVWVIDGRSGEMRRITYDSDSSLLGPQKATRFVRQEHPNYQWTSDGEDGSGNIETSEPIPVVVDGTVYWQVFVVPTDSAGVSQVSYVNADTGTVTSVESDDGIRTFLEGQVDEGNAESDEGGATDDSEASMVITVEYPDGSTETVTVPEGGTVSVEHNTTSG